MCRSVFCLFACMHVYIPQICAWWWRRPEEGIGFSGTVAIDSCEPLCGCWALNPGTCVPNSRAISTALNLTYLNVKYDLIILAINSSRTLTFWGMLFKMQADLLYNRAVICAIAWTDDCHVNHFRFCCNLQYYKNDFVRVPFHMWSSISLGKILRRSWAR